MLHELLAYRGEYNLLVDPRKHDPMFLYDLIKVHLLFGEEMIIFAIQFPLIKEMSYDLYRLFPLPTQHSNSSYYSYIIPKHEFLLMSKAKTSHASMQDLTNCKEFISGQHVCFNLHIIDTGLRQTCEIQLLSPHVNKIPDDCQTSTLRALIETWAYLSNNRWLYLLQEPTTLTVISKSPDSVQNRSSSDGSN